MSDKDLAPLLAQAVRAVEFVRARSAPFDVHEFARALDLRRRSAYRWLDALEAAHVVEIERARPRRWKAAA